MYRWVNDDNPDEYISVPWFVTGSMSDPAQAVGSGLTYTQRQFLQAYFQIAQTQDTDVDAYRSKQREAEVSEDRDIASKIIAKFDKILKIFLSDNPDKKEEVIQFVSRYAKKADYNKIKEPALASKLLDDFVKTFGIAEVDE